MNLEVLFLVATVQTLASKTQEAAGEILYGIVDGRETVIYTSGPQLFVRHRSV